MSVSPAAVMDCSITIKLDGLLSDDLTNRHSARVN